MSEDLSVADRVRARFAVLPAKQQSVARLLTEEPSRVAMSSVSGLAERAGVDAATVVRTCQSLGYSGWRELLNDVKDDLARRRTFAERVADLEPGDAELVDRIHDRARRNVDETFDGLDRAVFDTVAGVLSRAGMVVVMAGGVSTGVGAFLASSLEIIGIRSQQATGLSAGAPLLAPLGPHDVVLGISVWRYLRTTVKTLSYAKDALGVTTVALTDSPLSPAAQVADHTLVAQTSTVGPRMSMTGMTALIEALVARTALMDPARSERSAGIASRLYFGGHVLDSPPPRDDATAAWQRELDGRVDA